MTDQSKYLQERRESVLAVIPNSETTSNAINCQGKTLVEIEMPSAFTGSSISIQSSFDNVTFQDAYNIYGIKFSFLVGASRNIHFAPVDLLGAKFFRIVSDSSEGAERTLKLILMGV